MIKIFSISKERKKYAKYHHFIPKKIAIKDKAIAEADSVKY